MSDPVTNVQIEDVLSSIRRLVSVDDRPKAEENESEEQAPEALVLTPSLRVSGDEKPQESIDHAGADDVAEEAVADDAHDDQDDWSDDAAHDHGHADTQPDETAEADDGTAARDDWSDENEGHDSQSDTLEQTEEDDSAEDTQHEVSFEEDHSFDAEEESQHDEDHQDDHEDHQDDHDAEDDHALDDAPQAEDMQDDDSNVDELTARVAGFEDAVAARDDGWEPDGEDDNENAAAPMDAVPWEDDTSADDGAEDQIEDAEIVSPTEGLDPFVVEEDDFTPDMAEPGAAVAASNAFMGEEDPLGDDAAILDEEALRDLVTDIVREELQGALGERITRNVRKLVRREIHRALATKELE